jgi:hypothetical protein
MRPVSGVGLPWHQIVTLEYPHLLVYRLIEILCAALGLLLACGLRAPLAGGLVALVRWAEGLLYPDDSCPGPLIGAFGAVLPMIGPGA